MGLYLHPCQDALSNWVRCVSSYIKSTGWSIRLYTTFFDTKLRAVFSIRRIWCDGTLVLTSTKGIVQPDVMDHSSYVVHWLYTRPDQGGAIRQKNRRQVRYLGKKLASSDFLWSTSCFTVLYCGKHPRAHEWKLALSDYRWSTRCFTRVKHKVPQELDL